MLSKLLFRHLPAYYPAGSGYGHFPFMVPETMKGFAKKLDIADDYTWSRPPIPVGPIVVAKTYEEVTDVLRDTKTFGSNAGTQLDTLTRGVGIDPASVSNSLVASQCDF